MPKTENGHTDTVWNRIDWVTVRILSNDKYMQAKRGSELADEVIKKFNVDYRQAARYIAEAKKEIRKLSKKNAAKAFERAMRDRELLFRLSMTGTAKDLKTALDIAKDRDKLAGLYVENVSHSGSIDLGKIDYKQLSKDQLKKIAEAKTEDELRKLLNEFGISTS